MIKWFAGGLVVIQVLIVQPIIGVFAQFNQLFVDSVDNLFAFFAADQLYIGGNQLFAFFLVFFAECREAFGKT